jgi:methylated-DNA-protein-cysteine methyltransferase related protein
MSSEVYRRIYAAIRRVPRGRVATYGQIAEIARASGPRQVGYALHALPAQAPVPWYRVVNAAGRVSIRSSPGADSLQRALLEAEGVAFDAHDRIALDRFQWEPRRRRRR